MAHLVTNKNIPLKDAPPPSLKKGGGGHPSQGGCNDLYLLPASPLVEVISAGGKLGDAIRGLYLDKILFGTFAAASFGC